MFRGRGRGRGLGRGRGSVPEEQVEESHASQVGLECVAGVSTGGSSMRTDVASVPVCAAGVAAGAAGLAADVARARGDRMMDLLTSLLERLPERVPAQAPVFPVGAEVEPQGAAVVAEELPSYLGMMEQLQRIGTGFFPGGASPEDAEAWLRRLERSFLSCGCPAGYRVDIAVHFLEGDAYSWWRSVAARRAHSRMVWADFVEEFYSRFVPREGLGVRRVVSTPSFQAKGVQQQAGSSRGSRPMQGQKRKRVGASGGSRGGQGCFGCGSIGHRVASCPQRGARRRDSRVCYRCGEVGHIRVNCSKVPQVVPIAAVPIRTIPAEPLGCSTVESGEASPRPVTGNFS